MTENYLNKILLLKELINEQDGEFFQAFNRKKKEAFIKAVTAPLLPDNKLGRVGDLYLSQTVTTNNTDLVPTTTTNPGQWRIPAWIPQDFVNNLEEYIDPLPAPEIDLGEVEYMKIRPMPKDVSILEVCKDRTSTRITLKEKKSGRTIEVLLPEEEIEKLKKLLGIGK